jgi:plastocyanin
VNSVNFKIVKNYINTFMKAMTFLFFFLVQVKVMAETTPSLPTSVVREITPELNLKQKTDAEANSKNEMLVQAIRKAVKPSEPTKEIVILNTESGFIPEKVQVKKGEAYKIHIVNLNMKEKNVSFLMDSFTQSHNTVYGVKKTFNIEPQVEGIYSYQCPETGLQGQLIVIEGKAGSTSRRLASVDEAE